MKGVFWLSSFNFMKLSKSARFYPTETSDSRAPPSLDRLVSGIPEIFSAALELGK